MPLGVSSVQWDMRVPWGSQVSWAFSMFNPGGIVPFTIAGHTFEYVVKQNLADTSPLIKLTTDNAPVPTNGGTLVTSITPAIAAVILTLYPPATKPLSAPGTYYHALWIDYADAANAKNLFWGQFFVDPAIQP